MGRNAGVGVSGWVGRGYGGCAVSGGFGVVLMGLDGFGVLLMWFGVWLCRRLVGDGWWYFGGILVFSVPILCLVVRGRWRWVGGLRSFG